MKDFILAVLGWGSFALFLIMQLPQILKMMKTKNIEGVAVQTWVIYTIALSMSGTYLYMFNEVKPWPAILNQGLSALLSLSQVGLYYRIKATNKGLA